LIINGREYQIINSTMESILKNFELDISKVVVELNGEILDKNEYETRVIDKESSIEIVAFVGGG